MNYPITPGAFQKTLGGSFVSKLAADGSGLLYSTFLGSIGTAQNPGEVLTLAIAVDSRGQAVLTGETESGLPVTLDAYQAQMNGTRGGFNAFLTEFTTDGSGLVYSSYLGGSSSDTANAVAVDSEDNAYIGGFTTSSTFPTTPGSFDTSFVGPQAAFIAKFGFAVSPTTAQIAVGTSPAGLVYSVDGTQYTSKQVLTLTVGSTHTISTTSPQGSNGTRQVFTGWSDGGALSHNITVTSAASYTANFNTEYLLATNITPVSSGAVTPASGTYYMVGASVPLTATPSSGYAFKAWTGNVASVTSASTTITMSAPETVTASFVSSGSAALFGNITSKTGSASARDWSIQVSNNGPGAAVGAAISGVSLVQTGGTACTPSVTSALPASAGSLAPGAGATVPVTISFAGCAANARFTVTISLSANSGSSTGSIVRQNQFQ